MEKSRTRWSMILPSLIGLVSGLAGAAIAVGTVGYMEKTKAIASVSVDSYVGFIEGYFIGTKSGDSKAAENLKRRSSFTVFAKAKTLKKFAEFRRCRSRSELIKCKHEWAALVQSMRTDSGLKAGDVKDIIDSIWLK